METIIKYNRPKEGSTVTSNNSSITSIVQSATAEAQQQEPQLWKQSLGANTLIPTKSLNKAEGLNSVAIGTQTQTKNEGELSVGIFNKSTANKTFFSVGDGTDDVNRHNLFEVTKDSVIAPSYSGDNATFNNYVYSPTISGNNAYIENIYADFGSITAITSNTISTNQLEAVSGYIKTLLSDEITVDYLTVTKAAHFFKLIIDEIKASQGQIIITPANAVVDKVDEISGGWRCYYRAKDGKKEIYNCFEVNDQVVCQTFNVATGTSYNVSNTYYWRKVTATGSTQAVIDNELTDCHYFDLSSTDCDQYSISAPKAGDNCVMLGNRTDTTRQAAIIISAYNSQFLDKGLKAPSIVQYQGINDYDLSKHRMNVIAANGNTFIGDFQVINTESPVSGTNITEYIRDNATSVYALKFEKAIANVTVQDVLQLFVSAEVLKYQGDELITVDNLSGYTCGLFGDNGDRVYLTNTENTKFVINNSSYRTNYSKQTNPQKSYTIKLIKDNEIVYTATLAVTFEAGAIFQVKQDAITAAVQDSNAYTDSGITTVTNRVANVELTASGLTTSVQNIQNDYVVHSELTQTADEIELNVYNNLEKTGIDITNNHITIDADKTEFTGNIILSDPNDGIIINDNYGNPKINIQNNTLGTLPNFDFGVNKGIRIQEDSSYNTGQTTVTHTFAAKTLGTLKAGQKLLLSNMGFSGWFNTHPFDTNVTSASYSYVVKCGSSTVTSKTGTATKNSDKWPYEWRIPDNTLSSVSYNGSYTFTLTVTLNLAADSRTYTGKFYWNAYVNSYAPTTNIIRLATDGAVIAATDTQYNWFGSDLTQIRNGSSAIRAYNGKIQRNTYNVGNSTNFSTHWGDISSTVPYRIVNTTACTATTDDCMIFFSTVVGNNDAQRVLYLPEPSTCPGKFYFVKNGEINNTIAYVSGHTSEKLFIWQADTGKEASVNFGGESEIFISCGLYWICFNCD